MSIVLYANNAASTLAGSLSAGTTTATLASGTGALFPSPGVGQYFVMTFSDAATNTNREIVNVTARSGDTLTIVRGREGTSAQSWAVADNAQNLWTAGSAASLAQVSQVQVQADNYAVDSGSGNTVTASLSLSPGSYAAITGSAIRIKKAASANTGAATVNLNGLGAQGIVTTSGAAIAAGSLPASGIFTIVYDGANFQLQSSFQTARSGEGFTWYSDTAPAYALECNGAAISRTTYVGIFNAIGTTWGSGDGSTTFNLPDFRGVFGRGWDHGRGVDAGRGFASQQSQDVQQVFVSVTTNNTMTVSGASPPQPTNGNLIAFSTSGGTAQSRVFSGTGAGTGSGGGVETRPINIAVMYCICI